MPKSNEHVWAIDGIEEGVARIEEDGKRMLAIPRHLLPAGAREGQLLRVTRAEVKGVLTLTVTVDEAATAAALERSAAGAKLTMAASRKRDPGGDVAL
jgi:hypothetical protein